MSTCVHFLDIPTKPLKYLEILRLYKPFLEQVPINTIMKKQGNPMKTWTIKSMNFREDTSQ